MTLRTGTGLAVPLDHVAGFLTSSEADQLFTELRDTIPWGAKDIQVDGMTIPLTRLICWVGEFDYDFYGARIVAIDWTPTLAVLRDRLEVETCARYNSVLLNLYRDGTDRVDWHADDEAELGPTPTIASVSVGGSRRFLMRHKPSGESVGIDLDHGSLAVMHGDAQSQWQHCIPAASHHVDARINLTFRWFKPPA